MKRFFCAIWNHIEYFFIAVLFAGVFYLAFNSGSFIRQNSLINDPNYYVNKIFDNSYVHRVDISIDERDYDDLLANPTKKTRYLITATIDGEVFENVGFSTRGNVSLFMVAKNPDSDRYSYKLNFQKYGGNDYHGLDKLLLGSLYSDASYIKDHLAYEVMRAAGVASPLTSYTELYINGELKGLYLAIEDVDDSFLERNNFPAGTALYKPEALGIDHAKLEQLRESLPEGEKLSIETDPASPEFRYEGSDLVYINDDPASYPAIFDNAVNKVSAADREYLVQSIESLSDMSISNPADYWDVDALSKYFAANIFLSNFDTYTGSPAHNYYLATTKGKNTLLPWDYNLSLSDVWIDSSADTGIDYSEDGINWPIDSPLSNNKPNTRPAWKLIYDNPDYLEKYHTNIQKLLDEYFISGDCTKEINKTAELIRSYVYDDPTRFFTTDEFEDGIKIIRAHILLRADSVQKQLWGLLPSSRKGSVDAANEPIDQ